MAVCVPSFSPARGSRQRIILPIECLLLPRAWSLAKVLFTENRSLPRVRHSAKWVLPRAILYREPALGKDPLCRAPIFFCSRQRAGHSVKAGFLVV